MHDQPTPPGNTLGQDQVFELLLNIFLDIGARYNAMTGIPFNVEQERQKWWAEYNRARLLAAPK